MKRTAAEVAAIGNDWARRIPFLLPKNVLELGTGQGASGNRIMSCLPQDSFFTTINYVDGHHFGEQVQCWKGDKRFKMLDRDTLDARVLKLVPDNIDLLFIDSTHEAWHAAAELRLWQSKLVDGAVVVVDDLDQHDMASFWNSIPYDKMPHSVSDVGYLQGVFIYDASTRYTGSFNKPDDTTYNPRYQKDEDE